jgi:hypothetical protein
MLIILHDLIQVLHINRRFHTKDDHFSTHIKFTTIYLLQTHRLKYNNYSEQQLI